MKTSELSGAALDWAVAKCEGAANLRYDTVACWWFTLDGKDQVLSRGWSTAQNFAPSTDWAQGGPILQRHISELIDCGESGWEACCNGTYGATGKTALEAVCKAYVASKLGDDVDVPEELT